MHPKEPTPYPVLNSMLTELMKKVREQLNENFIGSYLHGSFATGDFTEFSDVDILIVIEHDLGTAEIPLFQTLHKKLFRDLPKPWGQRIELSYAPVSILRRWTAIPTDPPDFHRSAEWVDPVMKNPARSYPFWYLDNGADTLVRSEHDNSSVVRWVIREKGIVLMGPDPKTLIDPIFPKDLALDNRDMLRIVHEKWATEGALKTRMLQTFFVTFCVRVLHTLATGVVTSKKSATEWAVRNLDLKWHPLIEKAWFAWDGYQREHLLETADQADAIQTIAFIEYTLSRAELISQ